MRLFLRANILSQDEIRGHSTDQLLDICLIKMVLIILIKMATDDFSVKLYNAVY